MFSFSKQLQKTRIVKIKYLNIIIINIILLKSFLQTITVNKKKNPQVEKSYLVQAVARRLTPDKESTYARMKEISIR